jgi:hypothetical protein
MLSLLLIFILHRFTKIKILNTPLFEIVPLKLHNIIILENYFFDSSLIPTKERISIDFIPILNKTNIISVLLGKPIPGNIRICFVSDKFNIDKINKHFMIDTHKDFTFAAIDSIKSEQLKKLVFEINNIYEKQPYNLYTFNCQHFRKQIELLFFNKYNYF